MEMYISKLQKFVAMPQTDNNEAFLFVTPRSRRFDFIASRTAHLPSFLTFFDGSPYLVLLGGRLTVLGHSLEKYESMAILTFWAPAANTKNHNIPNLLPSTTTSKTENYWKIQLSLLKYLKLQKRENFVQNSKFLQFRQRLPQFWNFSSIQRQTYYPKTKKKGM